MTIQNFVLDSFRTEFGSEIQGFVPPPFEPLSISPWIAASMLQKAIRRGHIDLATKAAASLLESDPARLWHRLAAIAFEDIGLADTATVGVATSLACYKRIRRHFGGEWPVAACLVARLALAPKSRAADDLFMAIERLPILSEHRIAYAQRSQTRLELIALRSENMYERGLALCYLFGTDFPRPKYLQSRRGNPVRAFEVLEASGTMPTILEIAREGYRKTHEMLSPLFALLSNVDADASAVSASDVIPAEIMIDGVPSWVLDGFTREGRLAIGRLVLESRDLNAWMRATASKSKWLPLAASALFHVEGGLLKTRSQTPLSVELRRINEEMCAGIPPDKARELFSLIAMNLPLLNAIRADVMKGTQNG